jgi:hypothetical protein
MIVKKVSPLSVAKVAGILYALIGLCFGALFSLFAMIWRASLSISNTPDLPGFPAFLFGTGAIVIFPVFYGVMGFVFALIGAALYNVVSGWVGGIELEIQ